MARETVVCGVQQVGVGIYDVVEAYNWYIKAFGCDVMVVDDQGVAERMLPYTGGKPRPRRAVLACNIKGGGGFEVWEPKDGNITPPAEPAMLGDKGISVCKIKACDIDKAVAHLKSVEGAKVITVSAPGRYIHTPSVVIRKEDYRSVNELVYALVNEWGNRK